MLSNLEPRLRTLLPSALYVEAWLDPSTETLSRVFDHLRTLYNILSGHLPRHVLEALPQPGETRHQWEGGTLMFTDLAGFTPLLEANARRGQEGAYALLQVLNDYFASMIEIVTKSGGNLLEFTGDAMLVQFPSGQRRADTARAVRAGLRMQRAMQRFADIDIETDTSQAHFSLGMRVGLHVGRFLTTDIGTPRRMEHVLLGGAVQRAKRAEGSGQVGRVCLTRQAQSPVQDRFHFEAATCDHVLVVDDLTDAQLGEYDIAPSRRRLPSMVLLDRSVSGLLAEIERAIGLVEPLASYIPGPVLRLLIENAARRRVPPDFAQATVMFVTLLGLAEEVNEADTVDEAAIVFSFSHLIALINAEVEARGGVMRKVTYHLTGPDIMILFGVPNAHADDSVRAAQTALAIREIVAGLETPLIGGRRPRLRCQIGMARGPVFVAEFGDPRGRREFNMLGDTVNTAARMMTSAAENQIRVTTAVRDAIADRFEAELLGVFSLKGKAAPVPIYALKEPRALT